MGPEFESQRDHLAALEKHGCFFISSQSTNLEVGKIEIAKYGAKKTGFSPKKLHTK